MIILYTKVLKIKLLFYWDVWLFELIWNNSKSIFILIAKKELWRTTLKVLRGPGDCIVHGKVLPQIVEFIGTEKWSVNLQNLGGQTF